MNTTVLDNRRALVTGATGGLGREIARKLAGAGCRLFLTARREEPLAELAEALSVPGRPALHRAADLQKEDAVRDLAADAQRRLGGVDILVNCAGVFPVAPVEETTDECLDGTLQVNVRAPFALCRAVAPGMKAQGWGRIVNIGSSSAYAGFRNTALYCASKHALLGLSRALQDELKSTGVRVFCVSPGSIKTEMGRRVLNQNFETFLDPAEVADYVLYIISFDGALVSDEIRLNRMIIQ